jgi:alpha-D-ribose 1-methylphosphonate 5-triphosphate synthase subunit PhnH
MTAIDLAAVLPGFDDPAYGSQAAFRAALQALSRPGTLVDCERAAYSLCLALLDQDTRLWLSPSAQAFGSSLRFHTGCLLMRDGAGADFVFAGNAKELPPLESLALGTDEAPHRSATVILEVGELAGEHGWTLAGPGIPDEARLHVPALGAAFLEEWKANYRRFPRGVDLFLCSGARVCGLPRTTRIEVA